MYVVLICCQNNLMKLEFCKLVSPTIQLIFISALYLEGCVGAGGWPTRIPTSSVAVNYGKKHIICHPAQF